MPIWQRNEDMGLAHHVDENSAAVMEFRIGGWPLDHPHTPESIARRIYETLLEKNIDYHPLDGLLGQSQQVLTHAEVLRYGKGNCLDLSVLFCALALHYRLYCVLVVFNDHAMVLVDGTNLFRAHGLQFRADEERLFLPTGVLRHEGVPALLMDLVSRRAFIPIECTGFAAAAGREDGAWEWQGRGDDGRMPFNNAWAAGWDQLERPPEGRQFEFALDLRMLRGLGIAPHPALAPPVAPPPPARKKQEEFVRRLQAWLKLLEFRRVADGDHAMATFHRAARDRFDAERTLRVKIVTDHIVTSAELAGWVGLLPSTIRDEALLACASLLGFDDGPKPSGVILLVEDDVDPAAKLVPLLQRVVEEYTQQEEVGAGSLLPAGKARQQQFVFRRGFTRLVDGYDVIGIRSSIAHQPLPQTPNTEDWSVGEFVDRWLDEDSCRLLVLIGDEHHGKTSLMSNLWYQLAERYLDAADGGHAPRLPLFFRLKDYEGGDLIDFMVETLERYGEEGFDRKTLTQLHDDGELLLLLDSFDEIVTAKRVQFYNEIMTLLLAPSGRMILSSSRDAFREAHAQSSSFGPFDRPQRGKKKFLSLLELRPYGVAEVEKIAKQKLPENWREFMLAWRDLSNPQAVVWPRDLEMHIDNWRPGSPIKPISQVFEEAAAAMDRKLLRRLAYAIGTRTTDRPLVVPAADVEKELAALPEMAGATDEQRAERMAALADGVRVMRRASGDYEFADRSWLDYFHADYLVERASEARSFDDLIAPPPEQTEVAEFTRSLVLRRKGVQDRICEIVPPVPERGTVEQWLFWRELISAQRLQGEFDREDARRREAQLTLLQRHEHEIRQLRECGIDAVIVPGANFVRGSWETASKHILPRIVRPPRIVAVSHFIMSSFVVTNRMFKEFIDANPGYRTSAEIGDGGRILGANDEWRARRGVSWRDPRGSGKTIGEDRLDHPVVQVSRDDAIAYCQWLSQRIGRRVELPTEAQWELAARGSLGRLYPWGNAWDPMRANCVTRHVQFDPADLQDNDLMSEGERIKKWWAEERDSPPTTPVDTYPPNALGLYDLAGNVWEWTLDWYSDEYYDKGPDENPVNDVKAEYQIIRGGGWDDAPNTVKCYWRYPASPGESADNLGFRLALPLEDLGPSRPIQPES